jgi:hypothetical protein
VCSLLAIVAIVAAVNVVCQAESQTLLTSQVRQAVLNGQAKLVGQLPENQTIHFDIELALPHQAELENSYSKFRIPPVPPTGTSSR